MNDDFLGNKGETTIGDVSKSDETVKNIGDFVNNIYEKDDLEFEDIIQEAIKKSEFKVAENVLPEKPKFWVKVKNVLFSEVKVELTPYQEKVKQEVYDFLHQEVDFRSTWKKVDSFLFKEIKF